MEGAGDTNGDGVPDVVASGPGGAGVAFIYSGRDGRVLQSFKSPNAGEAFGNHVSTAGDVNHDGYAAVIIGSPGKEGEGKLPGHAYVYSGKDGRLLLSLQGDRAGDEFGSAVAGTPGTIKGPVLVVGAPRAGPARSAKMPVMVSARAHRTPATLTAMDTRI